MDRSHQESVTETLGESEVEPLSVATSFRERSFQRLRTMYRDTKKFAGDFRRGSLTTLGDMSDGVNTLSLYGGVGSVALFVTGVGARLFNLDDATNLFSEAAIVTGTVGGFLSVTTALATDSFTRNLRHMARL
ncbi:hypothetical protein K2P56_00420 [Patescibacteria group bacterium]|nr:hypothetical protein [Patescibacteria group bacterium]